MHALIAVQVAFCFLVLFVAGPVCGNIRPFIAIGPPASPPNGCCIWITAKQRSAPSTGTRWRNICAMCPASRVWRWPAGLCAHGDHGTASFRSTARLPVRILAYFLSVSPGWLDTMKIPPDRRPRLPLGRYRSRRVAIVNEAFARQYFNGAESRRKVICEDRQLPVTR